jgi:hypothetical protein
MRALALFGVLLALWAQDAACRLSSAEIEAIRASKAKLGAALPHARPQLAHAQSPAVHGQAGAGGGGGKEEEAPARSHPPVAQAKRPNSLGSFAPPPGMHRARPRDFGHKAGARVAKVVDEAAEHERMAEAVRAAFKAGEEAKAREEAEQREARENAFLENEEPSEVLDCGIYGDDCNHKGGGPDHEKGTYMEAGRTTDLAMELGPSSSSSSSSSFAFPSRNPRYRGALAARGVAVGPNLAAAASYNQGEYHHHHHHHNNKQDASDTSALAKELYREAEERADGRDPMGEVARRQGIVRNVDRALSRSGLSSAAAGAGGVVGAKGKENWELPPSSSLASPRLKHAASRRRRSSSRGRVASGDEEEHHLEEAGAKRMIDAPQLQIVFPPTIPKGAAPPKAPVHAGPHPHPPAIGHFHKPAGHGIPPVISHPATGASAAGGAGEARHEPPGGPFEGGEDGEYVPGEDIPEGGEDGAFVPRGIRVEGGEDGVYEARPEEEEVVEEEPVHEVVPEREEAQEIPVEADLTLWTTLGIFVLALFTVIVLACCIGCCVRARNREGASFTEGYSQEFRGALTDADQKVAGAMAGARVWWQGVVSGGDKDREGDAAKEERGGEAAPLLGGSSGIGEGISTVGKEAKEVIDGGLSAIQSKLGDASDALGGLFKGKGKGEGGGEGEGEGEGSKAAPSAYV